MPYDNGVLGQGKFEGRKQTLKVARKAAKPPDSPNYSLQDQLVGQSADALVESWTSPVPSSLSSSTRRLER